MSKNAICNVIRNKHFDICTTIKINTDSFYEHTVAEHSGLELSFCPDSSQHRNFRNKSYVLKGNQGMIFNGREKHIEECSKNPATHNSYSIIIETSYINRLLAELNLNAEELLFEDVFFSPSPTVNSIINTIFNLRKTPQISYIGFDCIITDLLIKLLGQVNNIYSCKLSVFKANGYYPSDFIKAKLIMRENLFEENFSLNDLSVLVGLSKYHFSRNFKKHTGYSPIQYLNKLKVDFIKEKLLYSKDKIIDIAYQAGYNDLSTFNKSFLTNCSMSPTKYKKLFLV